MAPVLLLFCAAVILYDLKERRVPNRLAAAGLLAGLVVQSLRGWEGLKSSVAGIALGLLLLFPFFAVRMVGGGDVKALAAIGAIIGPRTLWFSFLAGAAAGGLVAASALLRKALKRKRDEGLAFSLRHRDIFGPGEAPRNNREVSAIPARQEDIGAELPEYSCGKTGENSALGPLEPAPESFASEGKVPQRANMPVARHHRGRLSRHLFGNYLPSYHGSKFTACSPQGIPYAAVMAACSASVFLVQTVWVGFFSR